MARTKARRAQLQAPHRDEQDADEDMQAQQSAQSQLEETQSLASSDEEHKESERLVTGDLLRSLTFYLTRTLSAARRAELRLLITQNGGRVASHMGENTVEIVERTQLQKATDANWVAAEFIEDSIRDGALKEVMDYMAKTPLQEAMEDLRWTPSGRKPKSFYTVQDDATMLQFVHDEHHTYFGKPSVPERIWRIAQVQKLLGDRTYSSMHQRYRTKLVMLTRKERAALFKRAGMRNPEDEAARPGQPKQQQSQEQQQEEDEEERGQDEVEEEEVNVEEVPSTPVERKFDPRSESRVCARSSVTEEEKEDEQKEEEEPQQQQQQREMEEELSETNVEEEEDVVEEKRDRPESEEEIQGRAKKRRKKSTISSEEKAPAANVQKDDSDSDHDENKQSHQRPPSSASSAAPSDDETREGVSTTADAAATTTAEEDSQQDDRPPVGEVFRSYWQRVASDALERTHLERFFVPPSPTPAPESHSTLLASLSSGGGSGGTASGVHRTPQRSRRLSQPSEHASSTPPISTTTPTATPLQRRRARRSSTGAMSTPGSRTPGSWASPAQTAQHELLSQLEEMVGQRMTPPRRKSLDRLIPIAQASEDDADALIKTLQLETAHDLSTVCSALYWASGDGTVARDFLFGQAPPEMWSPSDDKLLVDYMRLDITEAEIAHARHRGVFERMRIKRSARDILRRIQFLQ